MRITNNMLLDTFYRNLNNNMESLSKYQEQLSSKKRINRPSDDPVGVVDALRYRTTLGEIDKYRSNVEDGKSWLDLTDSALKESGDILQQIRELAVKGASADLPQTSRDSIAAEIDQLKKQLIQIGNTTYSGRYIFSGTLTQTTAFDGAGVFQGNTNAIQYQMGVGSRITVNVDGSQVFGNLFTNLTNLENDLTTGDTGSISSTRIGEIDTVIDKQLEIRADVGARINRIDYSLDQMDDLELKTKEMLSNTEDVDMAQVIMQMKDQENVYQASLSAGAKIIQPTLVDYLR